MGPLHYRTLQRLNISSPTRSYVFPIRSNFIGSLGGNAVVDVPHEGLEWSSDLWLPIRLGDTSRMPAGHAGELTSETLLQEENGPLQNNPCI